MKKLKQRIIVGISGSSGIIYAVRLLEALKELEIETHLIMSKAARLTLQYETDMQLADFKDLCDVYHPINDISASIASGTFKTEGMIIAPCSMKTLAAVAHGLGDNLLSRAADVVLKERRRLVLMPREAPLNLSHLRNMVSVTEMGGIIYPPMPAFYHQPENIDDLILQTVGRILDLFNLPQQLTKPWKGE